MLELDQVTTVDWNPKGLSRYILNAKHETYDNNKVVKVENKRYFQSSLLKSDAKKAAIRVAIPLVMAMMVVFWKKEMAASFGFVSSIALDATVDPTVNTLSWSHTTAGINRCILVPVGGIDNLITDIAGTYNSVAMSTLNSTTGAGAQCTILGLIAPTLGAHTVQLNSFGNQRHGAGSISFKGAEQSGFGATAVTFNNSASTLDVSLTTTRANSYTVESWLNASATSTNSAGHSQTRFVNQTTTNLGYAAGYQAQTTVGSKSLGFTSNNSGALKIVAVEVKEYASPHGAFLAEMIN